MQLSDDEESHEEWTIKQVMSTLYIREKTAGFGFYRF